MTAIIFGANGQDGFYLKQLLLQQQAEVIGVSRSGNFLTTDISNFEAVAALIKKQQPDYVFHLAANSTTQHTALFDNHATISTGTINILEAVKVHAPNCKVFISGSGLQFKNEDRPIKETDAFEARDPYAVSRIHSVYAARYYRRLGIKTYVGYFFNHDSPLRTERHMTKKIAAAVKRIETGSNEKIEIGDISVIKEYGFAGDIVKAVWALVQQDKISEANLATGEGHTIKDWLEACFTATGKNWQEHVILKIGFVPEYKILVADPSIIFSLGWKPELSFEALAQMMLSQ
jgi:GDPmannose 4,6-dehydratase